MILSRWSQVGCSALLCERVFASRKRYNLVVLRRCSLCKRVYVPRELLIG